MMSRFNEIAKIYDYKLSQLRDPQVWQNTLRLTSNFWRLNFCAAMLLTEQNPKAVMCGTLAQWNNVGRYVRHGERSTAIFMDRNNTELMYLFDVTQTYGTAYNAKWKLSERMADGIVGKFNAENAENAVSFEDFLKKSLDKNIDIVYNYDSKLNNSMAIDPRIANFIRLSAECICMTRCGIEADYDFSDAVKFNSDLSIVEVGNAATALAQEVLRDVDRTVRRKEYERYEAGVCGRHLRYPLRGRQERTAEPEIPELWKEGHDAAGAQGGRYDERNGSDSARPGEHERAVSENLEGDWTESRERQEPHNTYSDEEGAAQPDLHGERTAEDGNRYSGSGSSVGFDSDERDLAGGGSQEPWTADEDQGYSSEYDDEELNEDNEMVSDETDAISVFSDRPEEIDSKSEYAQKLLEDEILHGNHSAGGKFRITEYISDNSPTNDEFAKFLKNEYGIGGGSRSGIVKFSNHDGKGLALILGNNGNEQTVRFGWKVVAKAIRKAVDEGRYITEKDIESARRYTQFDAEHFAIHYEYQHCFENSRLQSIRKDIKRTGLDIQIRLTPELFATYAEEYIRAQPHVKEEYQKIERSSVNAPYCFNDWSTAAEAARTLTAESGYPKFRSLCRDSASELVTQLTNHTGHNPGLGFPEEEITEFLNSGEISEDKWTDEITAQVFGYLFNIEQRDHLYDNNVAAFSEETSAQLTFDNFEEENSDISIGIAEPTEKDILEKVPTITCEWSESPAFEEGKTYSVLEFDTIMKREDTDWVSKRQQELKAFGGDINKLYEAREKGELKVHHQGYAKTHFTVNMPNGTSYSERQDIGDGYGGVIDFLDRFGYKHVAEELKKAANAELSEKFRAQAEERVNSSQENNSFHITDETDIGTGGLKTKFQNNIAAITTLKTIESESRSATPEEQKILAKYVGWGGMPQAFDQANEQWSKEYKQLRELLTDDEYKAAAESTLNAHYTSPEIIGAMYKALNNFGFNGGNVLEPAMGVGNFFGCMPESMNNDSRLYGVELDSLTGRIAQQLYPQADIRVQGFEKSDFPDNFFDAAIGNVPFGNYGVADRRYDKEHFLIHDYFFAKTLDKVAPGGVVAFVTSKGTLDKKNSKVREYLAKRADLIGAIRLPNNAFKNANTEVTSDIIFLQKREKMAVEMPDWAYTGRNSDGMPINQYFIDHPDMVLGKLEYTTGAYGQEVTCTPIEGEKLSEQLDRAVAKLRADMKVQKREERQDKERGIIPATADVQNFTHTLVDGKLYFRENNVMTEVKQTGKDLERMKGLHGLRQTLRELIDAQSRSCSDEELHGLQAKLNTQYDSFKKEYGSINDRLNANVFRCDDDYNTLCSLEIVNAEKKTTQKSDIFTQRTIKPTVDVTHVETPQEAMQVSLDMKGRIDISYMAQLCDREPEQVVNELVQSNQIYLNPEKYVESEPLEGYEESSEYLSGNVREKLRAAERAAKDNPELFGRNVAGLTDNLPKTIGAGDITTHLGASWIDVRDYERFLKEYIGRDLPGVTLRRTSAGEYKVENKTFDKSVAATNTYGTERMSAYHIFENLLNHRDVTVKDRVDLGEDKYKYVVNTKQTQLATEKARQMNEAFSKWVWAKPERRDKYVTRYNELFNSIVGRHFDGSHQTFPGMSPYIQLKPHQKDAVARAKFGGNTLLAHCVGAGKSFEMIAATMEKKRLGLINKACVVVPKALVGQTANEWLRLYPQAKILVAGDNDFSKDNRQKFIGRCCTGDYAAVVMSYEQFEKIQMSVEYRQQFLQRELDRIQSGIKELNPYLDKTSIKDLQREQKRIKVKIEKLLDTAKTKDTSLTFEQLGFDSLVVDEAHNYKNGLVVSKMNNVSGVQTTAAQKSEDILMKTQYLNETYGTKNILFATGTPVTNSMTELYTMQRYLRPDLLDRARLQTFDDWAGNFGEVVSQLELKPAGDGFRTKKRFAKFTNLPELMQMYKEFADIRTADMLKLDVPELEGGKPQTIVAKPNDFQKAYMQVLAQRSEDIHSGSIDPSVDNMLKVTHEARLLGLDARAINPEAENTPDSKVNLCIDKVMEIYKNTEEQKGVQAIFCDIAVNSTDGKFSVYDYIKEELQRRGIPANEICTAGDAKDQNQRNEMFSQLRAGQKRIVLASTSKLGTGANIQTRLAALHNLDIPWKPSDLEQRNGRIIRQGNQFGKVGVFNYVTENTFDAYMMNIIVTKQKFISQLMSGKTPARTCEDVDDMVLNYSEMQALATGDPRIKEKIELDTEVSRLRTLESEHYNNQYKLEDVILNRKTDLKGMQQRVEFAKGDKAFAEEQLAKSDEFSVKLDGKIYTERSEAGEVLAKEIVQCMARHEEKTLGEYKGFEVSINTMSNPVSTYAQVNLKRFGGLTYSAQVELDNNLGNITRMENLLKNGIDKEIARCEERIERDTSDIKTAEETLAMPFALADELQHKVARLDQLNAELDCGKNDEVFLNDDNDREEEKPSRSQGIKPDTPSARPKR